MNDTMQALQTYFGAFDVLASLTAAVEQLGLVRGAFESGILQAANTPSSPQQIAAAVKLDVQRVSNICNALEAHGVFIRGENGHYQLADKWAILTASDTIFRLDDVIDKAVARSKILASKTGDYWSLDTGNRLALAKGSAMNPSASLSRDVVLLRLQSIPEIDALLTAGAKFLDLGCGVSGGLLSILRAYPLATAVGVEIAADLLVEARRRATALGVADRVTYLNQDACEFDITEAFDLVWWSQFFFPLQTRSAALKVALHALKPGGFLLCPVPGNFSPIDHVIYDGWGVPLKATEEMQHEVESAGFSEVRTVAVPIASLIVARRL